MIITSEKRSYVIGLKSKLYDRVTRECSEMSRADLQRYINDNFEKANALKSKTNSGAWRQGNMHHDKAKVAIIEMDKRRSS